MRAKELERLLGELTGLSAGEIDSRVRTLRERGLILYGPRGRHAPHIDADQAAMMLLALVSRRATDAGMIVERLAVLSAVPRPPNPQQNALEEAGVLPGTIDRFQGRKLGWVLARYLERPDDWTLPRIEVAEDGRLAWVYTVGRIPHLFTNDETLRAAAQQSVDAYERQRDEVAEHRFVFGRGFLIRIGQQLRDNLAENDAPGAGGSG